MLTRRPPPSQGQTMTTREPWQQALVEAAGDPGELARSLGFPAEVVAQIEQAAERFPFRATRHYLSLARPGEADDPVLRQVLPHADELDPVPGFVDDAVGDLVHHPAAGLVHKYAGRALLVVTGACAVNCRFCFRRAYPYEELRGQGLDDAMAHLAGDSSVREVILSGGDPLSLPDAALDRILSRLEAIPYLRRLRIHSRMPVVLPSRITAPLLDRLEASRLPTWFVTHFNHPQELHPDALAACQRLARRGIPVLNQAVLLRGINDSEGVLAQLMEDLVDAGIKPYYLHQLDRVAGTAHFEVPEERGRSLFAGLRARVTGLALPAWVRDRAGASSKLPLGLLAAALLIGCGSEPEPVEPRRSSLAGVMAEDVKSTASPTPTPAPAALPAGTPRLLGVERVAVAHRADREPLVFFGAKNELRWGTWDDASGAVAVVGRYPSAGALQVLEAADLDGDGTDEVFAGFGVGKGFTGAPASVVLVSIQGKAVITRVLWEEQGARNQITALAPWPRKGGFDLYVAAFGSRFDVRGGVLATDGTPPRWLDGHQLRMGMARAVGDFDADGKADVAIGRLYGDSTDQDGDLRVLRGAGDTVVVPTQRGVRAVGSADLDGDGTDELLFGDGWHKKYGVHARYRPSIARWAGSGFGVELLEERSDQYAVERIRADGARIVAAGNASITVYERGEAGWAPLGERTPGALQGGFAILARGDYLVAGAKLQRLGR